MTKICPTISQLNIEQELRDTPYQELAREISKDPALGDPDTASISNIEVGRKWDTMDLQSSADDVELMRQLSKRVGASIPNWAKDSSLATKVLGPPQLDSSGKALRETRILCTIGPKCDSVEMLTEMIEAGMDVARINFSYIRTFEDAQKMVGNLQQAMKNAGREIKVLADLQGPKIRIYKNTEPRELTTGSEVILASPGSKIPGAIEIEPHAVLENIKMGHRIFMDDGKLALEVKSIDEGRVSATVKQGGTIVANNGVNVPDTVLPDIIPTEHDLESMEWGIRLGLRLFAMSFGESVEDVQRFREAAEKIFLELSMTPEAIDIIFKAERARAFEGYTSQDIGPHFRKIAKAVQGIMVARGDASQETSPSKVPVLQYLIHTMGNDEDVLSGTATQMIPSMIKSLIPERSESSDIFRSVMEGAEFVMTSNETAMGEHPVEVIKMMVKIILEAEKVRSAKRAHSSPICVQAKAMIEGKA